MSSYDSSVTAIAPKYFTQLPSCYFRFFYVYGAESILRSSQSLSWPRNSLSFM